mmetsp:Transcript_9739/g.18294  ORF Transcript_9739/g.18294 Transcript_9739/m.18294 type:complete len:286 (+) Transcript_9739:316-1173(+)|eukprot:CAMPEP_0176488240 /NCGR_PEP_ID=MMETSP0200_2-20121128/6598_1 /TAXON_ID=947934 /ORGANISM="Chaetoceros sp., Strain GSL56" /LENGTH=285 /DNA_ID=CAMNT_0017885199 /DNA_START=233 /DNA_END=1090 /DNA_ORIENTATION=+
MRVISYFTANAILTTAAAFSPVNPSVASRSSITTLYSEPLQMFPTKYDSVLERIEGGGTVKTCRLPDNAQRVIYKIESFGRPLKGEVKLWYGPIREVHTLKFNTEDGKNFPVEAVLKFKPQNGATLKCMTSSDPNCPMKVSISVPTPEQDKALAKTAETLWYGADEIEKKIIQGGSTDGRAGAWVYWTIPDYVDSVQMLVWSIDTGKKSFKADIECLRGPNNQVQKYLLQCGGGNQPYHAVFQTPGQGWVIRANNLKYLEDGKVQMAILPYKESKSARTSQLDWN